MACSAGNDLYRYTEQVGMMPRGFAGLTQEQPQQISFPPQADLVLGGPPVALEATSTAGLPVHFYVEHGPAEVVDGHLKICQRPARAQFPLEVKIVAWQFGSAAGPVVQTAEPVEQMLEIVGPSRRNDTRTSTPDRSAQNASPRSHGPIG